MYDHSLQSALSAHKFTGKERDGESGLDEFGARYYGSSLGRFMTPDWAEDQDPVPNADLANPQSLDLYSYVQNNPLTNTDPDGHKCDNGGIDPKGNFVIHCSNDPPPAQANTLPLFFPVFGGSAARAAGWTIAAEVRAVTVSGLVASYLISPPGKFAKDTIDPASPPDTTGNKEATPATKPDQFEPVRGTSAKKDKTTGEIWVKDKSRHGGDHYEVYKNKGAYEKGDRDRQVWADGRPGKKY